jgi:hypothetical protein
LVWTNFIALLTRGHRAYHQSPSTQATNFEQKKVIVAKFPSEIFFLPAPI